MNVKQWKSLIRSFGLAKNQETFAQLTKAYSEKHRYYHTAEHIRACLNHLDNSRHLAEKPEEIELALWFHDAIYKPTSKNNELNSALWAEKFLRDNNVDQKIIDRVYKLIMVTLHDRKIQTKDEALMVDIDLTILGSHADSYAAFEKSVRKEYRWIPYFYYRKKRKEVLQGFLNNSRIYHTDYYFDLFERQARVNIKRALSSL